MEGKKNTSEHIDKEDSDEIPERLVPVPSNQNKGNLQLTDDQEVDDQLLGKLFRIDDRKDDTSIDHLFEEERNSSQKYLQDEVQKALSQPEISKAGLFRMRTSEPSESAFAEEIAKLPTVEEIWENPTKESSEAVERKSVIVMCILVSLILASAGWGLWQSTYDRRGNETDLSALANEIKEKESNKLIIGTEIISASGVVDQYLKATTVDQKSKYIYQAESLKDEIKKYYEDNGGVKPITGVSLRGVYPIIVNGEQILQVVNKDKNSLTDKYHSYYVRKNSSGDYKVDWKADVVFQDSDVKKFKETRSKKAINIKCIVYPIYDEMEMMPWVRKRAEYNVSPVNIPSSDTVYWRLEPIYYNLNTYNWGFNDKEYHALRLEVPNSDILFWGYVKKGSQAEKKLFQYMDSELKRKILDRIMYHEFILTVRFLADSPDENDQYVIIDDVVSSKWINMDE